MKCDAYFELICGHIDGVNSENEEQKLAQHLRHCKKCRELLSILTETDHTLATLRVQAPQDLTAKIMAQVQKEPKKKHRTKLPVYYFSGVATGLATVALLALTVFGRLPMPNASDTADISDTGAEGYQIEQEPAFCNGSPDECSDSIFFSNSFTEADIETSLKNKLDTSPFTTEAPQPTVMPSLPSATDAPDGLLPFSDAPSEYADMSEDLPDMNSANSTTPFQASESSAASEDTSKATEADETKPLLSDSTLNHRQPIRSEENTTPILLIWDADPSEIALLSDLTPASLDTNPVAPIAETSLDPYVTNKNGTIKLILPTESTEAPTEPEESLSPEPSEDEAAPETLLNRFMSMLCLPKLGKTVPMQTYAGRYRMPSERDPSFSITTYETSFSLLSDVFSDCVGQYEIAAYYPAKGLTTSENAICTVFVVDISDSSS